MMAPAAVAGVGGVGGWPLDAGRGPGAGLGSGLGLGFWVIFSFFG